MGACMSSGGVEVSEEDKRRNKEVEKELKEAKAKLASQVKVLLLGSGDSGKSTILKQMRLIHKVPFTPQEVESYRQLVFNNLTHGLQSVLEAMDDMDLQVSEENQQYIEMIESAADIKDHEPFPQSYYEPLKSLWADENLQKAYSRGNEAALPENLEYFFPQLDRLFKPDYQPHELDIVHCRARTIGITETMFQLKDHEMLMVDVGGQKSERRKWIHCFQDVTSILFLVSLSGYDQCLVEDKDANQMQDAMTIWDSICHSQWFKQTSIILFLNKNDLFEKKIAHSDIKNYFPDYDGEPGDVRAGREYFKKRFARLAQKAGAKEREIYIHLTTATDTAMLRVVMAAVEGTCRDHKQEYSRNYAVSFKGAVLGCMGVRVARHAPFRSIRSPYALLLFCCHACYNPCFPFAFGLIYLQDASFDVQPGWDSWNIHFRIKICCRTSSYIMYASLLFPPARAFCTAILAALYCCLYLSGFASHIHTESAYSKLIILL